MSPDKPDTHPTRNIRILFVDEDPGRAGSTVSLEYLLSGFHSAGYEVSVLTLKKNPLHLARLAEYAAVIELRDWKMSTIGWNLYFTNTLSSFTPRGVVVLVKEIVKSVVVLGVVLRAMRDTRADIVYANEYVVVSAYVAAAIRRVPSVVHIRSPFLKGSFGIRRAVLSRLIPECSRAVIAITPIEAAQLCPGRTDKQKIHVVGEFVEAGQPAAIAASAQTGRDGLGVPPECKVVTMLGGILAIKGTIDFIHAAVRVVGERDNAMFVIAGRVFRDELPGGGVYYDACMRAAEPLLSAGRLKILGEVIGTAGMIAATDILVSPSPQSHFSRPVVEAWSYSKPVVAVRTTHMSQLVQHGVNGFLVEPGDDVALASYIVTLLRDPDLSARFGREGRKKADEDYNAARNIARIVEISDRLVGRGA